jgi:2-methylisocitrate lyase-like PEP mutase family enzyme
MLTHHIYSGAATTASRLGQPDLAIATLNDFVQSAQMVCSLDPTVPVIADADTGFGGPAMVARTVTQYARAGVAGLHIEDQVQTKRCGHLLGKQVVSREEFVTRIRAAVIARDSIPGGSDFVIIGRTDSAQVLGMDEAVARLQLAADAGADVCFIEGVKSKDLLESTVQALSPKPVSFEAKEYKKKELLNSPSRSSSTSFLVVSPHPLLRRRQNRWEPKSSVNLYLLMTKRI